MMVTPYDEPVSIYLQLIEDAYAQNLPLHDYQQTLDTLKKFKEIWTRGYEQGRKDFDHLAQQLTAHEAEHIIHLSDGALA